jgi:hypothetical protein
MDRHQQPSGTALEEGSFAEADEAGREFASLTSELHEKEELIHALTAQLEQAVEQLDRIQREGGNRGGRGGGSSAVAGDFVEEQRYVNDRLNQWLDLWDQQQPFDLFARLEHRLEEIVQRGVTAPAVPSFGFESTPAEVKEPEDTAAAWEEAKRQLLGDMSFGESAAAPTVASIPDPPGCPADLCYPSPVELETAERVVLVDAVEVRDRYIAYLTQRLRALEMQGPTNWDALNNSPHDLRIRLEQLEADYREHLRREECDMALERARLAREQNRLKQDRHKLEVQARKLGLTEDVPGSTSSGEGDNDDRSWRKMFGRKK